MNKNSEIGKTKIYIGENNDQIIVEIDQIWIKKRDARAIRLTSFRHFTNDYNPDKTVYYAFYDVWDGDKWIKGQGKYSNGEVFDRDICCDDLTDDYSLFTGGDFEKVYEFGKAVIDGEEEIPVPADSGMEDPESMALMGNASKSLFENASNALQKQKDTLEMVQMVMDVEMEKRKNELWLMKMKMDEIMGVMNKKLEKIHRVIDTIELYLGVYQELVQIKEGKPAKENDTIHFRQMTLFMDEELVLKKFDADFQDIETFDGWLVDNYRDIVPEEKCVVMFKPRRYDKQYTGNSFTDSILNRENQKSYMLIRNGENLYRVWSDLWVGKKFFPSHGEMDELLAKIESFKSNQDKKEKLIHGYQRLAFVLQGLFDRTDVFAPIPIGVKIFELDKWGDLVKFIYDYDDVLPSGRLPFKEWQSEQKETIDEGSRVVVVGMEQRDRGDSSRFYRYYSEWKIPKPPSDGLYTVYRFKETLGKYQKKYSSNHGSLCIKYNPGGTVTHGWDYWDERDRKNNVSFKLDIPCDNLLNYDVISLEEIDFYLYNRADRRNYYEMIPVLLKVKSLMLADMEWEKSFVKLIMNELNITDESIVWDCIRWWKVDKVKWKRAITKDDTKALKMIKSEIKKRINNDRTGTVV